MPTLLDDSLAIVPDDFDRGLSNAPAAETGTDEQYPTIDQVTFFRVTYVSSSPDLPPGRYRSVQHGW